MRWSLVVALGASSACGDGTLGVDDARPEVPAVPDGTAPDGEGSSPGEAEVPPARWRVIDVPSFADRIEIGDTKVYRLRKDNELVFVFSQGAFLNAREPRSAYIGHVDRDDRISLTDLKLVAAENTEVAQADGADAHVHVTSYNPDHIWVSWACGSDNHVCAVRSDDGGLTFNRHTFFSAKASPLSPTTHEPSLTCSAADDCLLTWSETLLFGAFDVYSARWTAAGWCAEPQMIGEEGEGMAFDGTQARGSNGYLLAITRLDLATLADVTLTARRLSFPTERGCTGATTEPEVIDSGFQSFSNADGEFPYVGGAGNISPRDAVPELPSWLAYSHDGGIKVLRIDEGGANDATETFSDPDPQVSLLAGNVDFDGTRFYVFYHRFVGRDATDRPNTYSICYRSTADAHSAQWSAQECPIVDQAGPGPEGGDFGNYIQPVGSAWKGQIAVIFQKSCQADHCDLALARND